MGVWSCCKGVNSRYLPLDKFANQLILVSHIIQQRRSWSNLPRRFYGPGYEQAKCFAKKDGLLSIFNGRGATSTQN